MKRILTIAALLALTAGCARFSTKQTDIRYEAGSPATAITTKASAWTFFSAKSNLQNFKAKQTEATQSADVGSLAQEADATNIVAALEAMVELAKQVK